MRRITWALPCLLLLSPAAARADGLYGRFGGDFVVSAGAGAGVDPEAGSVVATLDLRARYLDAAGLVVAPELRGSSPRVVAAVEVRPLFPALFLLNAWSGEGYVDLLLESLGFELGVAFDRLDDPEARGSALAFGAGFDVPLLLPGTLADGLFLRLGARHVHALAQDLRAPEGGASDWTIYAILTVRAVADLGVAAREPPRFRPDR